MTTRGPLKAKLPPRFLSEPCDHCNATGMVERVNPKWLREMRQSAGISLRAMAKRLDISAPFLSDVELGRRNPNIAILKAYGAL